MALAVAGPLSDDASSGDTTTGAWFRTFRGGSALAEWVACHIRAAQASSAAGTNAAAGRREGYRRVRIHGACETEIHDHGGWDGGVLRRAKHDVLALEIAMEDAGGVRRRETQQQLSCDGDGLVGSQPSPLDARAQAFAIDEFHGQE